MLSDEQIAILLRPINPRRVLQAQGQSHLPAFDVEAHLSRIFGFDGWDKEILDLWLIHEDLEDFKDKKTGAEKQGWTVTYGCKLRLTVYGKLDSTGWRRGDAIIRDGTATGSANHLPLRGDAHDFAIKNADSYALKRAAKSWGDQFGLSLYNKGMTAPLVGQVVGFDKGRLGNPQPPEQEVPEPLSMGHDEVDLPADLGQDGEVFVPDEVQALSQEEVVEVRATLAESSEALVSDAQMAKLHAALAPMSHDNIRKFCGSVLMVDLESMKHLTWSQAAKCIDAAERRNQ